jgi:DNA-directed RNA polymerase subunit RPC12/RpoP
MSRDFARFAEPDWEEEPVYECVECGAGIYNGDSCYYYNGEYYCEECGQALKIDSEDFYNNAERREL